MPLSDDQFIRRIIEMADPILLCEVLGITSQDIVERFEDYLDENMEELREVFDVDFDEELEYNSEYDE